MYYSIPSHIIVFGGGNDEILVGMFPLILTVGDYSKDCSHKGEHLNPNP